MAYKDILPQTNLDAVDIRDTIGCPSNNLADYCVKAKTGGIGGYAFKIAENGHLPSDGYLIEGASPYFNIWSSNSPGEWVLTLVNNSIPKYRLRRNIYGDITANGRLFNSSSYCFDLGSYRGYIHRSRSPQTGRAVCHKTNTGNFIRGGLYDFSIGDYDWLSMIQKQEPIYDPNMLGIRLVVLNKENISTPQFIRLSDVQSTNDKYVSLEFNSAVSGFIDVSMEVYEYTEDSGGFFVPKTYIPFSNGGYKLNMYVETITAIVPTRPHVDHLIIYYRDNTTFMPIIAIKYENDIRGGMLYSKIYFIVDQQGIDFEPRYYDCLFTFNGEEYANEQVRLDPTTEYGSQWVCNFSKAGLPIVENSGISIFVFSEIDYL